MCPDPDASGPWDHHPIRVKPGTRRLLCTERALSSGDEPDRADDWGQAATLPRQAELAKAPSGAAGACCGRRGWAVNVRLSAAPSFQMPEFGGTDGVVIEAHEPERLVVAFFDTEDLRLARWGASLRHVTGRGWTLELPVAAGRAPFTRGEYSFPGGPGAPPAPAVDVVRAFVRTASLKPVARLRTLRRAVDLGAADEPLARVTDDEVSVLAGRRIAARFRRLEVNPPAGAEAGVPKWVVQELRAAGATALDVTPDHVLALGPRATEPPDVVVEPLAQNPTAGQVVRRAVATAVTQLICHHAAIVVGEEPEGVHQARVATRRLRSNLRTFEAVLEPEWTESLRDEAGWLGEALGATRDADVLVLRLGERARSLPPGAPGVDGLLEALGSARVRARDSLLAQMRDDRYVQLLDRLVEAAREPAMRPEGDAPADALVPMFREQWRSVRKRAKGAGRRASEEDLHDIRILTKRCRYSAEALAPLAGKRVRAFASAAGRLQAVLGEHNDAVTAERWLREWGAARTSVGEAFTAGELAGMERGAAALARSGWRKAWQGLADSDPTNWR